MGPLRQVVVIGSVFKPIFGPSSVRIDVFPAKSPINRDSVSGINGDSRSSAVRVRINVSAEEVVKVLTELVSDPSLLVATTRNL
jgi:hypothetical protein